MVDDWRSKMLAELDAHGLTMKAVSQRADLGDTFVRDMLKRGREPSAENLAAVRRAIAELLENAGPVARPSAEVRPASVSFPPVSSLPKDVPVMGTAAASAIGRGAFTLFHDPVDYVTRPPGLLSAKGVYALFVENDSMLPRYEHGELVYVNPFRPVAVGDYVVIQEPAPNSDNEFNAFIKQLVRRSAEWVETKQLNPPADLKFKNVPTLRVHKVMTWADLFGF